MTPRPTDLQPTDTDRMPVDPTAPTCPDCGEDVTAKNFGLAYLGGLLCAACADGKGGDYAGDWPHDGDSAGVVG